MTPLVSLLVPVCNAQAFLCDCLESALKQTYPNIEILCCDDASSDDSLATLRRYESADPRVRVFTHRTNTGVVVTRNDLLQQARGEYIGWLDADDYIALDKVERQLTFLRSNPDCGAVGTGISVVNPERELIRVEHYPDEPERQRVDPHLCCATVLARRDAAVSAGPFRELFKAGGEDGDWLLRIADRWSLRNLPDVLYYYRQRPLSISKANAGAIRRLGVIARAAARERRVTGVCPIDSGAFCSATPDEILGSARLSAQEKTLALSLPDREYPPLITVAVPYYDAQEFIEECLDSLRKQTFQNFEVVLYDDGSTQPLAASALCADGCWTEGRVKILKGSDNRGPAFARNCILAEARGRYVAFQDADDVSEPTRLWLLLEELLANPKVVAVGSAVAFVSRQGALLRSEVFPRDAISSGGFNGCCATFLYHRTRAPDLRFDERMRSASEDVDFLLRLEQFGEVRNIRTVLYRYRVHPNSLTAKGNWLEVHTNYMWRLFAQRLGVLSDAGLSSERLVDLILSADGTQTAELLLTNAYRQWVSRRISTRRFVALCRLFPRTAIHVQYQHFRLAFESVARTLLERVRRVWAFAARAVSAIAVRPSFALLRRVRTFLESRKNRPLEVRILGNWGDEEEALAMLLPGRRGRWDRVHFSTRGPLLRKPDYVLVLNQPSKPTSLRMSPNRVWFAIGEPPTSSHEPLHLAQGDGTVVFTPARYPSMTVNGFGRTYQASHTMTRTWWVKRTFEELNRTTVVPKSRMLSWVASNVTLMRGHRERLAFLERARAALDIDLFGRGFRPVEDKWVAIAPYYFSIAYENTQAPGYFTEKLMDCLVSLTVPFYVGAPDIHKYFPRDAIIVIDPDAPDVFERMKSEMNEENYAKRLGALREAKQLVLTRYNMFIHLADAIINDHRVPAKPRRIRLKPVSLDWSLTQ
jgi:glycosyltransferase involved in cell wall biosynthesis